MKKKIFFFTFGVIATGLIAALLLVDRQLYGKFAAGRLASELSKQNVYLEFDEPELLLPGIKAKALQIRRPPFPFPVTLTDVQLHLFALKLISGVPAFSATSKGYGGELSCDAEVLPASNSSSGKVTVRSLHLEQHPLFETLGIEKGVVSISHLDFRTSNAGLDSLSLHAEVKDFSKPKMTELPGFLTGGKPAFPIPPILFSLLKTDADYDRSKRVIHFQNTRLVAAQGAIEGEITLKDLADGRFSKSSRVALNGQFSARLTQKGAQELLPLISLVTGRTIPQTARKLRLSVKGSLASPKWLVSETS
jgi:hypothetical protein